jgi:hypothetical protein
MLTCDKMWWLYTMARGIKEKRNDDEQLICKLMLFDFSMFFSFYFFHEKDKKKSNGWLLL